MEDGSPWIALIVTLLLVGVNGMLASSELAIVGLNELKLKAKADAGDKKSRLLLKMKQSPSDFLSTIQIGITLAGLLSGAFAADSLAKPIVALAVGMGASGAALNVVRVLSVLLITLLLTYIMLVFGELVPKRLAMHNPEKVARFVAVLINGLSKVTKPLVKLLSASTNGVLRLLGVNLEETDAPVTEEEIMLMAREGRAQGTIEDGEVVLLTNLFSFTDLDVDDAMHHRRELEALPASATLQDVQAMISKTRHSRFPVYEKDIDDIVGIVHTHDIIPLVYGNRATDLKDISVRQVMREPIFVPEGKRLVDLFNEMKERGEHMAVVVDEYGGTAGFITLTDIIEEIVGDIERSQREDMIVQMEEGYRMDGGLQMKDVARALNVAPGEDDRDTLSGFLTERLGHIPAEHEVAEVLYEGYRFIPLEVEGAFIGSVLVTKMPEESAMEEV